MQTHHGPAPLLDPALSETRVRATLQTRPSNTFAKLRLKKGFCSRVVVRQNANSQTTKTHDRHFSTFSMPSAASGGHYSNSKFGIRTLPLTGKWRLKFLYLETYTWTRIIISSFHPTPACRRELRQTCSDLTPEEVDAGVRRLAAFHREPRVRGPAH